MIHSTTTSRANRGPLHNQRRACCGGADRPFTSNQMPNPLHPNLMSAEERIAEICQLLARGLVRLQTRQSSSLSADRGDSCVDFLPHQSGHADAPTRRQAR